MFELKEDYTQDAADHFGITIGEVTAKHVQFIKEQNYARNYGYMVVPKRAYQVHDNGSVEFIRPILSN